MTYKQPTDYQANQLAVIGEAERILTRRLNRYLNRLRLEVMDGNHIEKEVWNHCASFNPQKEY